MEKKNHYNFICHLSWLKKPSATHTHDLISICEFLKPYGWLFLEFESFVKGWIWIGKKMLYNFICHLSFLKKLSPTHAHPLISICEFLKPYEFISIHEFSKPYKLLFLKFWVMHKRFNVNWKKMQYPPHLYITHPTLHNPPNPYITHSTPTWPISPYMTHPTPA